MKFATKLHNITHLNMKKCKNFHVEVGDVATLPWEIKCSNFL